MDGLLDMDVKSRVKSPLCLSSVETNACCAKVSGKLAGPH